MLTDGISLLEGSVSTNLTIASGSGFPSSPSLGELFFLTGAGAGLYVYNGSTWELQQAGGQAGIGSVVDDTSPQLGGDLDTNGFNINGGDSPVLIKTDDGSSPQNITLSTGSNSSGGAGSNLLLSSGGSVSGAGGDVRLTAGGSNNAGAGGDVEIFGGTSGSGTGGSFKVSTGNSSTTTRLAITSTGTWELAGSAGTSGQVLTSGGPGAVPTWTTASAVPTLTSGRIGVGNGSNQLSEDEDLLWDTASNTMTLGSTITSAIVNSPATASLTVKPGNVTTGTPGDLWLTGAANTNASNTTAGGTIRINAGYTLNGSGGSIFITAADGVGTGVGAGGGEIKFKAGSPDTNANPKYGWIAFNTGNTERFRILTNGAWSVGNSDAQTGDSGQVLTSQGASSPPTWTTVSGGGASLTANYVAYGTGTGIAGNSAFTYDATTKSFRVNTVDGTTSAVSSSTSSTSYVSLFGVNSDGSATAGGIRIIAGTGSGTRSGGGLIIQGGSAGTTGGTGSGGSITISAGAGGSTSGSGGSVTINGGVPTDGSGGGVDIVGRNGVGTNRSGGSISLNSGANTGTGTGGYIRFQNASVERFRITPTGSWSLGSGGTNYGNSGQALVSQGANSVPIWVDVVKAPMTSNLNAAGYYITDATTDLTLQSATGKYVVKGNAYGAPAQIDSGTVDLNLINSGGVVKIINTSTGTPSTLKCGTASQLHLMTGNSGIIGFKASATTDITLSSDYGMNLSTGAGTSLTWNGFRIARMVNVPANGSSGGDPGDFAVDAQYLYICIQANFWKRIILQAF